MVWCGVVWCDVDAVGYSVMWCGVVWCGVGVTVMLVSSVVQSVKCDGVMLLCSAAFHVLYCAATVQGIHYKKVQYSTVRNNM